MLRADRKRLLDCVRQVMLQLPGRHENRIEQLLHLWVPRLGIFQDLTNKVHGLLLNFC
jgi:hypothetical protein